jgi:hypothetical protein
MPSNISCPGCGHQGRLPNDLPAGAVLTCHSCRVKFPAEPLVPPPEPADPHGLGIWVGDAITTTPLPPAPVVTPPPPVVTPQNAAAHLEWVRAEVEQFDLYVTRQLALFQKMREQLAAFESKTRGDAILKLQALDRDRAILDARAKDLDAQEAKISAALKLQAQELHAELERQVSDERENLARRAEALTCTERSLERRMFELDEMERGVRRELEDAAGRLGAHPPSAAYDTAFTTG